MGLEEDHKDYQRAGVPPLQGQAERVGAPQPGQEKTPQALIAAFQYLKVAYRKAGEGLFIRKCSRKRGNPFKLQKHRFRLDIRKRLFSVSVVRY